MKKSDINFVGNFENANINVNLGEKHSRLRTVAVLVAAVSVITASVLIVAHFCPNDIADYVRILISMFGS